MRHLADHLEENLNHGDEHLLVGHGFSLHLGHAAQPGEGLGTERITQLIVGCNHQAELEDGFNVRSHLRKLKKYE